MSDTLYFVGGGINSLGPAHEVQRDLAKAGSSVKVSVLMDKFHAPIGMGGSHVTRGIDGLAEGDEPHPARRHLFPLTRQAIQRIQRIAAKEITADCEYVPGYYFLGNDKSDLRETKGWLVDYFGYSFDKFMHPSPDKFASFQGFSEAFYTMGAGQIDLRPFLHGLADNIKKYGGRIATGVRYLEHLEQGDSARIKTDVGTFEGSYLHLATGAEHSLALGLPGALVWTGAIHYQLDDGDMAKYFPHGPMAFIDSRDIAGDVVWGGVNAGVLTFGFGDKEKFEDGPEVKADLMKSFQTIFPDLAKKYTDPHHFSWGPIYYTPSGFPYAGRATESGRVLINTGWGGRAITPALVYGDVCADYHVRKNDTKMKQIEDLGLTALRAEDREPPRPGQLFGAPKAAQRAP